MVVADPSKKPKKGKKSAALPDGLSQLDVFSLDVADPGKAEPIKRERKPRTAKPAAVPEMQQLELDIFGLISAGFSTAELDPTDKSHVKTPTPEKPKATRTRKRKDDERPGQPTQLDFEALAELSASDAHAVPEREHVRDGAGSNGGEVPRPVVPLERRAEDELSSSMGSSGTADTPVRVRRRVVDEPEQVPSRDFHIRQEHGVGSGGLHEKARANITAIRLLKTLETENREATEEEKAVLVRYSGWGALAGVFEEGYRLRNEWTAEARELQSLLSSQEYESARATTPNAHFTSPIVIQAIWEGLEKAGVGKGAEVLEPSMGIGHFFGLQPESTGGGHRTGVELDSLTARIAKKLYPDSTVFAKGFEETQLPDNYFDVAVGNVPFGNYAVHDPSMPYKLRGSIHDYFFAKSLEKVRPGGMMALVTSHYTMDKKDGTIRKYLAEHADLVAAVRLPNTAFKDNAGTQVVTDVLFLRKRPQGAEPTGENWTEAGTTQIEGRSVALNEYYLRHPEMMLGNLTLERGMYRADEPTLVGELTPANLRFAMGKLPEGAYIPRDRGRSPPPVPHVVAPESLIGVKDGGYALMEGRVVRRIGDTFEPVSLSASASERVKGMIAMRDAVREVFRTQLDDKPEETITRARRELNRAYDQFVQKHGCISTRDNFRAFTGDPDHALLLSLENYDAEKKTAAKTAIFECRTLERYTPVDHAETAAEALAISLNETGAIHWERMASLTGDSPRQMQADLGGQVFQNPEAAGMWETADEYLSGNVRGKLRAAAAAAEINPLYRRNVEALQSVQPQDIKPGGIDIKLGAGWIPKSDVQLFIAQLLQCPKGEVRVDHSHEVAAWSVKLDYFANQSVANSTTWGTKRASAASLIEDALNMRTPTIYDAHDDVRVVNQTETIAAREMQQKIRDRFSKWVWEDAERTERLARLYNDAFNTIRLRTYDGSHLTLPGMNRSGLRENDLDTHQKDAVWRVLQNKNALIGHCVGAGKTATITASAMELKRVGLASKSMIVVPNHLVDQWGAAFLQLYPQANIFVAGKEHFTAGNREKAMARIATGNYDAVIISHKSFESLPVSNETFEYFVNKQLDSLRDAIFEAKAEKGETGSVVKELEKAMKRLEAKIKDRARREAKDDGVTFEQLGVDRIFVDEADLYKNLGFASKMNRISGLPHTESNRALDMYMKTGYLNERGGGTVFATGTPISNTMAEMYTLMRYLAPEVLQAAGVEHFDAWAANFGEAVTGLELAPDGSGYRMHTRFSKFTNLPELLSMFRTFADIQTADMLHLPRPEIEGGKPQVVASPASEELKHYVSGLVERAQKIRNGSVDPRVDNMLKITGDGRKAALDMRLVGGREPGGEAKVGKAIDNIHRVYKQGDKERLTQAVFCDMSTPNAGSFNVYDTIRAQLIERGIPEKEIAYIHDADTDAKKKTLFDAVNAGHVRILLGSTEKMGAGTNVQKKLVALHHLDAPWRPRDIEQRDGRILRQGNGNSHIQIYRYVTEGSFDAYMWQTLETKQRFISQVMTGDVTVRQAEDVEGGALSFAEIKAIASGNPAVMEKVRIDTEIRKLDMLRAAHNNAQYEVAKQVRELPGKIEDSKICYAGLLADIATRNAHEYKDEAFTITINGRIFSADEWKEAGNVVYEAVKAGEMKGSYRGFTIETDKNVPERIAIRGKNTYYAAGSIQSLNHILKYLDRDAEEEKSKFERMEKSLADYKQQDRMPFEHEERLQELLVQQQEINRRLDLDKPDTQIVAEMQQDDRSAALATQTQAARGTYQTETNLDRSSASAVWQKGESYGGGYLEGCGLLPETIQAFSAHIRLIPSRDGSHPNVAFRHNDQTGLAGWEVKNEGFSDFVGGNGKALFSCQVGETGAPSRIVICESAIDAMSYYQMTRKPGLYLSCAGELSEKQQAMLRKILTDNPQASVVTATDADRDGEKYAMTVCSMRQDAARARPALRSKLGSKYKDWNDVLTDRPIQPQSTPAQERTEHAPQNVDHLQLSPSVTPVAGRRRVAVPHKTDYQP